MPRALARGLLILLILLTTATPAVADEVVVLCPRGVQAPLTGLAERFETVTGHRVRFAFGTAGGVARRVSAGEAADLVITAARALEDLAARGKVAAATRVDLGRVGVGVAVRRGAPVPDVSTPETLRRALLAAPSIGYADPARGGQGGTHFAKVVAQLDLTEALRARTRLFPEGLQALQGVARGEIALAVSPISEILPLAGLTLAGPLPPALQVQLTYAAAMLSLTRTPEASRAFLAFLVTPAARAELSRGGLE